MKFRLCRRAIALFTASASPLICSLMYFVMVLVLIFAMGNLSEMCFGWEETPKRLATPFYCVAKQGGQGSAKMHRRLPCCSEQPGA